MPQARTGTKLIRIVNKLIRKHEDGGRKRQQKLLLFPMLGKRNSCDLRHEDPESSIQETYLKRYLEKVGFPIGSRFFGPIALPRGVRDFFMKRRTFVFFNR